MQEHPFTRLRLEWFPLEDRMKGKELIRIRKQLMAKYGIVEKDGKIYREDTNFNLKELP